MRNIASFYRILQNWILSFIKSLWSPVGTILVNLSRSYSPFSGHEHFLFRTHVPALNLARAALILCLQMPLLHEQFPSISRHLWLVSLKLLVWTTLAQYLQVNCILHYPPLPNLVLFWLHFAQTFMLEIPLNWNELMFIKACSVIKTMFMG